MLQGKHWLILQPVLDFYWTTILTRHIIFFVNVNNRFWGEMITAIINGRYGNMADGLWRASVNFNPTGNGRG